MCIPHSWTLLHAQVLLLWCVTLSLVSSGPAAAAAGSAAQGAGSEQPAQALDDDFALGQAINGSQTEPGCQSQPLTAVSPADLGDVLPCDPSETLTDDAQPDDDDSASPLAKKNKQRQTPAPHALATDPAVDKLASSRKVSAGWVRRVAVLIVRPNTFKVDAHGRVVKIIFHRCG